MATLSIALTFLAAYLLLRRPLARNRIAGAVLSAMGLLSITLVSRDGILRGFDFVLAAAFVVWSAAALRTVRQALSEKVSL